MKVSKDAAEQEFERFCDAMDLDVDLESMEEDDRKSFEDQKAKIVKAICSGSLVISENGEPVFTPQRSENKDPITFYEPDGATLMAMDRRKKNEDIAKLYSAMGSMTKTSASRFSNLKMSDLKICMALATVFLG